MNESCTIILPLPPYVLSPNCQAGSRGACMKKAQASKRYKRLAREATRAEAIETGPWKKVVATAIFFHKIVRRRDGVNHNAMLKAAHDGMIDAGLVVDDDSKHWTTEPPDFQIDREYPRVEITVERAEI